MHLPWYYLTLSGIPVESQILQGLLPTYDQWYLDLVWS